MMRKLLQFLLTAELLEVSIVFPYYSLQQPSPGLRFFALGLAMFALLTWICVWLRKTWAMWTVLTLVACGLTINLYTWAINLNRGLLLWLSTGIHLSLILIAFQAQMTVSDRITKLQKSFYGSVLALAAVIGVWGLFFPAHVLQVLPFMVPPLHARFLGSMYLSGASFMGLNIVASQWAEVRVVTPMIAIWTGMLGIVSLFHLSAFDWGRVQVWIWFLAYIGFPLVAAWIAWQQRAQLSHPSGPLLSRRLQVYFYAQGGLVTVLALSLLLAPAGMVTVWPWKITPILAQIYSAPFLSYGLGSLYAARQRTWSDVRIVVYATLVFTVCVLLSSVYHQTLFQFSHPATWLWFGGFALASLALGLFGTISGLRTQVSSGLAKPVVQTGHRR